MWCFTALNVVSLWKLTLQCRQVETTWGRGNTAKTQPGKFLSTDEIHSRQDYMLYIVYVGWYWQRKSRIWFLSRGGRQLLRAGGLFFFFFSRVRHFSWVPTLHRLHKSDASSTLLKCQDWRLVWCWCSCQLRKEGMRFRFPGRKPASCCSPLHSAICNLHTHVVVLTRQCTMAKFQWEV